MPFIYCWIINPCSVSVVLAGLAAPGAKTGICTLQLQKISDKQKRSFYIYLICYFAHPKMLWTPPKKLHPRWPPVPPQYTTVQYLVICDPNGVQCELNFHWFASLILDVILQDNTKPLLWNVRHGVLKDAAAGLQYLHTVDEKPLIHGDIKRFTRDALICLFSWTQIEFRLGK